MLKNDLLLKIKNQVSDYESIEDIDSLIDRAIVEAEGLIKNKDVSEVLKFDIAYFRFLLFVRQDEIAEFEAKMYEQNLKAIDKAEIKQVDEEKKERYSFVKVGLRREFE